MLGLATLLVMCFSSCNEKGIPPEDLDRERDARREAEEKLEEAEKTIKDLKKEAGAVDDLNSEKRELETESQKLRESLESKSKEFDELKKDFDTYKTRYRVSIRAKLVGSKIASITTKDGKTFSNCTVKDLTPVGLKISHTQGTGRVRFEDLPEETAEKFGYDAELAKKYLASEATRAEEQAVAAAVAIDERNKALQKQNASALLLAEQNEMKRLEQFMKDGPLKMRELRIAASKLKSKASYDKNRGRVTQAGVQAAAATKKYEAFRKNYDEANDRLRELNKKYRRRR